MTPTKEESARVSATPGVIDNYPYAPPGIVDLTARSRDGMPVGNQLAELGGSHSYKIVYIGFFSWNYTAVKY